MSPNQKKQPRTVFIDAACHNQLRLLYRKQIFCYGLALGVPSASGPDYVVHLAITTTKGDEVAKLPPYMKAEDYVKIMPPQKEPHLRMMTDKVKDDAESTDDDTAHSVIKDRKAARKLPIDTSQPEITSNVVPSLEDLVVHAREALRMMPGCCYVLGLFTVEAAVPGTDQSQFRDQYRMVYDLAMELRKDTWKWGSTDDYDVRDKFLLNYGAEECYNMGRSYARVTNVPTQDPKQNPKARLETPTAFSTLLVHPEDLIPIDWVSFYAQLDEPFDFRITRAADKSIDLGANIETCLRNLHARLQKSRIYLETDPSVNAPGVKVAEYLDWAEVDDRSFRSRIIFDVEEPVNGRLYGASRHNGYVRAMGEVSTYVFAHPDHTIEDVNAFVRNDLLRSVSGRLQLLVESMPDLDAQRQLIRLNRVQPPRRVYFWPVRRSRIQFCEYLFGNEDVKTAVENAQSVFGVSIEPHMVNQTREKKLPSVVPPKTTSTKPLPSGAMGQINRLLGQGMVCCNMFVLLSLSAVFVSLGLVMYFAQQMDDDVFLHTYGR